MKKWRKKRGLNITTSSSRSDITSLYKADILIKCVGGFVAGQT
jgi:hypothetical protein